MKNYYSDPVEELPMGKAIWGKTESGGELQIWCDLFSVVDSYDMCVCVLYTNVKQSITRTQTI